MADLFTSMDFDKILRGLIIGLEFIYCMFSFVMIRQVRLMNSSFTTKVGGFFLGFSRIHFLIAVGLVILSILLF
ncbi:MAG: DUF5657 family protein [Patescibacteria group bacterium]|jgi:hypothetical protein